jgi:hypothetical protein
MPRMVQFAAKTSMPAADSGACLPLFIHSETWAGSSARDRAGQVGLYGVQVDGVLQPGGEGGHRLVGVIAGPG